MTPLPNVAKSDTIELTPQQEAFCRHYYAGEEDVRGNGTRSYLKAYPTDNPKTANTESTRLLQRPDIRARMKELRAEAAEAAKNRARDWWELYPDAQDTLEAAANGEPPGETPQDKRSAVEAAKEIISRCLGSVKIQHEHSLQGQAIVAHVAGEPAEERDEDGEGREIPGSGPRIKPADEDPNGA